MADNNNTQHIVWHDDVIVKQFISYAVGCMMGRYSIDKPGLILANQGDGLKEYEALVPNFRFEIDDDGIIPLMPSNTDFADNATVRFKKWLAVVLGEERLVENLNTIAENGGYPPTQNGDIRSLFWLFSLMALQN